MTIFLRQLGMNAGKIILRSPINNLFWKVLWLNKEVCVKLPSYEYPSKKKLDKIIIGKVLELRSCYNHQDCMHAV